MMWPPSETVDCLEGGKAKSRLGAVEALLPAA